MSKVETYDVRVKEDVETLVLVHYHDGDITNDREEVVGEFTRGVAHEAGDVISADEIAWKDIEALEKDPDSSLLERVPAPKRGPGRPPSSSKEEDGKGEGS